MQANVRGTVEQVLEAYDHLQTEWLKSYAWQQRMMIRFIYGLPQKFCYTKQLTSAARVAGGFGPWMVADILLWMCAFVQ